VHAMTYPPTGGGDAESLGTRQVANSAAVIYPSLMRFYRCSHMFSDAGQPNSVMEQQGKRDDPL
jgi:hypothetical protein